MDSKRTGNHSVEPQKNDGTEHNQQNQKDQQRNKRSNQPAR